MGATYKWDAKDYAKNSTAQFDWANELIDKLSVRRGARARCRLW